jgi:hypothetical protein
MFWFAQKFCHKVLGRLEQENSSWRIKKLRCLQTYLKQEFEKAFSQDQLQQLDDGLQQLNVMDVDLSA